MWLSGSVLCGGSSSSRSRARDLPLLFLFQTFATNHQACWYVMIPTELLEHFENLVPIGGCRDCQGLVKRKQIQPNRLFDFSDYYRSAKDMSQTGKVFLVDWIS